MFLFEYKERSCFWCFI